MEEYIWFKLKGHAKVLAEKWYTEVHKPHQESIKNLIIFFGADEVITTLQLGRLYILGFRFKKPVRQLWHLNKKANIPDCYIPNSKSPTAQENSKLISMLSPSRFLNFEYVRKLLNIPGIWDFKVDYEAEFKYDSENNECYLKLPEEIAKTQYRENKNLEYLPDKQRKKMLKQLE